MSQAQLARRDIERLQGTYSPSRGTLLPQLTNAHFRLADLLWRGLDDSNPVPAMLAAIRELQNGIEADSVRVVDLESKPRNATDLPISVECTFTFGDYGVHYLQLAGLSSLLKNPVNAERWIRAALWREHSASRCPHCSAGISNSATTGGGMPLLRHRYAGTIDIL
jgi:hypothetical protein